MYFSNIWKIYVLSLLCIFFLPACVSPEPSRTGRRAEPSVKVQLQGFSKWQRVCDSETALPSFKGAQADVADSSLAEGWEKLFNSVRSAPDVEKMRAVNIFFNQFPYKEDMEVWGIEDHWATPRQFMQQGGDCEDYAIAKYFALRELGVGIDAMRIAGVWNKKQGRGHAVLLVQAGQNTWVLDNLNDKPVLQRDLPHYLPQYYANENHIWRKP